MRQVVRGQPHSKRQSLLNWLAWITVAFPAQATYFRGFVSSANMFALRLRGPFSAGLTCGTHTLYRSLERRFDAYSSSSTSLLDEVGLDYKPKTGVVKVVIELGNWESGIGERGISLENAEG